MLILLLILLAISISYFAYVAARISAALIAGAALVLESKPFKRESGKHTILVLGDSTAVGVGSPSELSMPGRLSVLMDGAVENRAHSGAKTKHVSLQLSNASRGHYDLILIQVGANDVIWFASLAKASAALVEVLHKARALSDKVVLLTAGDIGDAPVFAWPLNNIISRRTRYLRQRFMAIASQEGVVYADIFARQSPFHLDTTRYYSPDGLHLTGDGYGFWFDIVKEYVDKNWPELV